MTERSHPEADARAAGIVVVSVPVKICRRCVRVLSRRVSDVPGAVSLEVDAARGLLRVTGDVKPEELRRIDLHEAHAGGDEDVHEAHAGGDEDVHETFAGVDDPDHIDVGR